MTTNGQPHIQLGKCHLNSQVTSHFIARISPALKAILQSDEWKLGDRQFRDLAASEIFLNAQSVEAVTIWLDFNKKTSIISDILVPRYTHLRTIYLGDNNIGTIEHLQLLQSPLLEKLFLNHNHITSIEPLRKCYFPNLTELNLNGNIFVDESSLCQAHFPLLDKVSLGYKRNNQRIDENAWFVKAQIKIQTQILSPRHRLHAFNRMSFFNNIKEMVQRRIQPKDLFKTFEN